MAVANVNGALVGGASLKAADFLAIAGSYRLTNGKAVRGMTVPAGVTMPRPIV